MVFSYMLLILKCEGNKNVKEIKFKSGKIEILRHHLWVFLTLQNLQSLFTLDLTTAFLYFKKRTLKHISHPLIII